MIRTILYKQIVGKLRRFNYNLINLSTKYLVYEYVINSNSLFWHIHIMVINICI